MGNEKKMWKDKRRSQLKKYLISILLHLHITTATTKRKKKFQKVKRSFTSNKKAKRGS